MPARHPIAPPLCSNLLGFCAVACLQSGRLSLQSQIMYPLVIILLLLGATAGVALRLDLPGTIVAYYIMPTLAVLVGCRRMCAAWAWANCPLAAILCAPAARGKTPAIWHALTASMLPTPPPTRFPQGMCMAVLQGGVLNLACLFPPIYIQGFVVGAGLSGVGTSVLSFVTQLRAREGDDSNDPLGVGDGVLGSVWSVLSALGVAEGRTAAQVAPAAFAYFASSASITALCAIAFTLLGRLQFSRVRLAAHYAAGAWAAQCVLSLLLPPTDCHFVPSLNGA